MVTYDSGNQYMMTAFVQNPSNTSEKGFVENTFLLFGYAVPESSTPPVTPTYNAIMFGTNF